MSWKTIVWVIGLWGLTAQAVCVNGHPSLASEFQTSKAVVVAKVVGMKKVPATQDEYFLDGVTYQVKVEKRFKGGESPTLEVFSENSTGRFDMRLAESYLLFIYEDHGRLSVDNCGNSGSASNRTSAIQRAAKLAHLEN